MKRISERKKHQIEQEKPIREALIKRANGKCEECGNPPDFVGLHPHERKFRSAGGKLSLDNSVMLCNTCHSKMHNIKVVEE